MEFTLLKKMTKLKSIFFLAVLFVGFQSCQKSESESAGNLNTTVKFNLSVGSPEEENILVGNSRTTKRSPESNVQLSNVQISDNLNMEVIVLKDSESSAMNYSSAVNSEARAASQVVRKPLKPGVKYRIMVYNENGSHQGNYDYIYGSEDPDNPLKVNAGKTYTFVIYSVNSTTDLPNVTSQNSLTSASINSVSGDLMYFKKKVNITHGDNYLDAILVHQFSQITTSIEMDNSMTGSIEAISNTKITPTRSAGNLKLSDNSLTFSSGTTTANVNFPTVPGSTTTITADSTLIFSPATTSANFVIGSITLDGETKTNISVPNIKITPGHKYKLLLRFRVCTQNVTSSGLNWNYPEKTWYDWYGRKITGIIIGSTYYPNNSYIRRTFDAPQANYGFQFDITDLDNAFNMKVNDNYIFGNSENDQIQFQTNPSLGTVRNIEFVDGTEYATGNIPQVFNMKGTADKPLVRILISRTGQITMYGSKTSGGNLVQLRMKGNQQFNNVPWDGTGPNEVIVSQKVDGKTVIIGTGTGRKRVACPKK
ncbi:hypothetical protein CHU00_12650 [Sphingobacterium cellulitidis]|uniref:fimbrillin family protein n=1 Tax=Sphingobacterium cellulitidis TaxID=1768011 RepID=UPI000B93C0D7|nr:fimbrillin family protein [Sphingobacterium cellulitidis]OYD45262.1 hypothetical protein CHU00_12650 [Sphingobacterium cellulitidis]